MDFPVSLVPQGKTVSKLLSQANRVRNDRKKRQAEHLPVNLANAYIESTSASIFIGENPDACNPMHPADATMPSFLTTRTIESGTTRLINSRDSSIAIGFGASLPLAIISLETMLEISKLSIGLSVIAKR